MLEEASVLLEQKKETEAKQQLLDSFCKHFLVSDADLTTLTSSAEPVSEHFFEVLSRVKQIHKDCEILLGYENQRLGLELMEQTTRDLNAGYKKLFNSTLREFKGLDLEDPHISGSIRRSLRALSERPALFQSCLDSFAEARQSTVADGFQKALTDSTLGTSRAIEFSTHDPLRYIGDMLAWVHSATVSEMEALEGLFISDADEISRGLHQGKSEDPFSMTNTAEADEDQEIPFDGRAALNALISRNMASVAHTLTQRISITVRNLSEPVEIYKAYNIISFYHDMFLKLIRASATSSSSPLSDSENSLLSTLTDLQSQTFKHFETSTFESLHSSTAEESPDANLHPPPILTETLTQFTTIARTRGPNLLLPEFTKLYGTLLAPVINTCTDIAKDISGPETSKTIYKLNYLSLVRDTLKQLTSGGSSNAIIAAEQPLASATSEIENLQAELQEILSEQFLSASGLGQLKRFIDETRQSSGSTNPSFVRQRTILLKTPLSQNQTLSNSQSRPDEPPETRLEYLAQRLDTFLASALTDTQDDLAKLVDKATARRCLEGAVSVYVERFESVVGILENIDEGVERERLAKGMGRGDVNGDLDSGDIGDVVPANEDEDGIDEDEEEPMKLREVYPRLVSEVEALMS